MSGVKEERSISLLLRLDLEFLESTPKTLINSLHATARNFDTPSYWTLTKQLRLEKEKPVLEAFWSWLDQQKPVRNTRLDKAVNYVLNRRDIAETYLEDGRCSFTNNLSENAIRPFAVGRKNWLFSSSVDGANASAVVYTMVEMAKAHGMNIYGYLKFLLENRPGKNMTDEQLAELAPWSEKLQSIKNRETVRKSL